MRYLLILLALSAVLSPASCEAGSRGSALRFKTGVSGQTSRDWKGETIYFILTDRFEDGDKTNNQGTRPGDIKRYHGGDIQGIINRLDYLQGLGVTTLWVSPCMANQKEFLDSDGYHGYWVLDFFRTDEHQGTLEKFVEMVREAHRRGLRVLLDMPLNSLAWEHPFYRDPKKHGWFHHKGDIVDWNDPVQCEEGSLFGLPDLAHENDDTARWLIDASLWWARKAGVDGFRLDAVKHVPPSFWTRYCAAMHENLGREFFLLGEDFDGRPSHVGAYCASGMDSLFDFPLCFAAREAFARGDGIRRIAECLAEGDRIYRNPSMMSLMLENHDMSRFITEAGLRSEEKLKLALTFLFTIHRIPTVYYGLEVGMAGRFSVKDGPWNRGDMEWGKSPDILNCFTLLSHLRLARTELREGRFAELLADDEVYAYARFTDGPRERESVVVLNNGENEARRTVTLRAGSPIKDGTVLRDALSGETVEVRESRIDVRLEGKGARVFLAPERNGQGR
jgi:alpha-amylase